MSVQAALPALLALLASVCFGASVVFARRGMQWIDAQASSMVAALAAAAVLWLLAPLRLEAHYWASPALWVFLGIGLFHPMTSMLLAFEAARRMGATISATVAATAPLFATAGAVAWLDERLTLPILAGTVATVCGIVLLSWRGDARSDWPLWALVLPTGAALIRAANAVVGKYGLALLPSAYFGALVSFTMACAGAAAIFWLRTRPGQRALARQGWAWSAAGGVCIGLGVLSMYAALVSGRVIIVAPIVASQPLFALVWSLYMRQERLSLRLAAAVVLVVGGVAWISAH